MSLTEGSDELHELDEISKRRSTWTTNLPTLPGWYWYKEEGFDRVIVKIELDGHLLLGLKHGLEMDWDALHQRGAWPGEWIGPLEVPQ